LLFPELIHSFFIPEILVLKNDCTERSEIFEIKYLDPFQSFVFVSKHFVTFYQIGNINYLRDCLSQLGQIGSQQVDLIFLSESTME
jgi:hypothetical protein